MGDGLVEKTYIYQNTIIETSMHNVIFKILDILSVCFCKINRGQCNKPSLYEVYISEKEHTVFPDGLVCQSIHCGPRLDCSLGAI